MFEVSASICPVFHPKCDLCSHSGHPKGKKGKKVFCMDSGGGGGVAVSKQVKNITV